MKREDVVLEEKVEETKPEIKKVNRDVKALVLAKCLKIVVKGKPAGARFRQGGLCFVESVSIDAVGAVNDAKLIRAGKFRKLKSFIYEHSTCGWRFVYRGAKISEVLHAISGELSKEEMGRIARNGAVFTVEEREGLGSFIRDPYSETCPVKVTIYEDKSGKLPNDILAQNIKFKGQEFTPDEVSKIATAEVSRTNISAGKSK